MSVAVERVGDRIFLVSERPIKLRGVIPGAAFSTKGGPHWSLPLELPVCFALRERFGRELQVGPELRVWARETIDRDAALAALGKQGDAELRRVPEVSPVLAQAMAGRTYQRVAARFVAESASAGGVLIADQPGLGKTLEALGGIIESAVPGPYLVITPKTAVETVWAREIPRWWPDTEVLTLPEGKQKRNSMLRHASSYGPETFLVVHPEIIRVQSWWECKACKKRTKYKAGPRKLDCAEETGDPWTHNPQDAKRIDEHEFPQIFGVGWGAAVADESDRILLRRPGTMTLVRNGAELLQVRDDGLKIAMSGTPFRSRPHLLWGTLNWLRPREYPAFWRWAEMFYEMQDGWAGSKKVGTLREDRRTMLNQALNGIMLRRTKKEVAKDLPAKTYIGAPLDASDPSSPVGVWLPMTGAQKALYDKMERESSVVLAGGTLNAIGELAEMTRLKQFATSCGKLVPVPGKNPRYEPILPSNKLDYVLEKLDEMGYPDDPETKVVIASQFTSVLSMFGRVLMGKFGDKNVVTITGDITPRRRTEAVDAFNQEAGFPGHFNPHIMLLQTKSGGVALTFDFAEHTFIVDETWTPDDQEQVEDRTHRVSRPRPVFYHYLRSLDTIEVDIAVVNAELALGSHEVLDGRRGLEFARQVMEAREARWRQ